MKWSELSSLASEYGNVLYSDEYSEVRFGCDCGCGGDFYEDNPESWDSMIEYNEEVIEKVKAFCLKWGVEYDGV